MNPIFKDNDVVLVNRFSYILSKPKIGDLVILRREKYMIKRIARIKDKKFFVVGDNKKESTDSRSFGWINKKEIIGEIIYKI